MRASASGGQRFLAIVLLAFLVAAGMPGMAAADISITVRTTAFGGGILNQPLSLVAFNGEFARNGACETWSGTAARGVITFDGILIRDSDSKRDVHHGTIALEITAWDGWIQVCTASNGTKYIAFAGEALLATAEGDDVQRSVNVGTGV